MSKLTDYGIPEVGSGLLHPKHQDRWRLTFNKIGSEGMDSKNLSFQAVKVNRPQLTFSEMELHRYNSRAWIAGKHEWNDCEVTIEDDITGTASKVVQAQINRQKWLTGSDGAWLKAAPDGASYKFASVIEMLDGGEEVLEKWYLEGCWIKVANYGDLDYSANEKVTIALTIRYDHARQELKTYANGNALGGHAA